MSPCRAPPRSGRRAMFTSILSTLALITGPLISGPLVDVGGILNALQIGQFQ
ncbi:hypothetical protein ABA31_16980 [Agrococcus baldri]|uniref:Uncharacterized protein n=1 Tax=Agrococcus baldri TaxID=153730 RepID=A0AA87RCT8_9MICO|nr:hypothetical protein ABA31_16980 [Agrococcus baldri]